MRDHVKPVMRAAMFAAALLGTIGALVASAASASAADAKEAAPTSAGVQAAATASSPARQTGPAGNAARSEPRKPARKDERVEQREPSDAERASFDEFFSQRSAAAVAAGVRVVPPLFAPAFDIRRRGKAPWQVIASVDSAPRRVSVGLCRQIRSSFIYEAGAPTPARAAQAQAQTQTMPRWTESAAPPEQYVWLAKAGIPCTAEARTVLWNPALPPDDVAVLLRRQAELLTRARLLFAGNSQCARQRALNFSLAAVEPTPPTPGAPVLYGMVFHSDRDTVAKVAVRKSGAEFVAWNVSCD